MEVIGYHYTQSALQQILPKLLEKILLAQQKVVIVVQNEAALREIDAYLWTYSKSNLLPHGTVEDGNAHLQPIWLTTHLENPNTANVLIWLNPTEPDMPLDFEKTLVLLSTWPEDLKNWAKSQGTKTIWHDANGKWESIPI